ncbi:MAG: hypothetical protein LBM61_00655 [Prevotellaceae bacterium]|jgi:putative alpha-1,2-mannosidase|nr:hypothetical protein [Prevotellaceae bacterium]
MNRYACLWIAIFTLLCISCGGKKPSVEKTPMKSDIRLDESDNEYSSMAATYPDGNVEMGPVNNTAGVYCRADSVIAGFLFRYVGNKLLSLFPTTTDSLQHSFAHRFEVVRPGYYSVWMSGGDIATEWTATPNTAFGRVYFPRTATSRLYMEQLPVTGCRHGVTIQAESDTVLTGYCTVDTDTTYFAVFLSDRADTMLQRESGIVLGFDTTRPHLSKDGIGIKIGCSSVGMREAQHAIYEETATAGWHFKRAADEAARAWTAYHSLNASE